VLVYNAEKKSGNKVEKPHRLKHNMSELYCKGRNTIDEMNCERCKYNCGKNLLCEAICILGEQETVKKMKVCPTIYLTPDDIAKKLFGFMREGKITPQMFCKYVRG